MTFRSVLQQPSLREQGENTEMAMPAHTTAQHPSLMWDKLKAQLPAPCSTLDHIMPPPTIPIPQQVGQTDQ